MSKNMWSGGVRVMILNDKNELLMVRQEHEGKDLWMVPGGSIEEGETSQQAAVREIKEETGLDIETKELIWHIEEVSEKRGMRFVNFFLGIIKGGALSLGKDPEFDEAGQVLREARFVTRSELLSLERVYPKMLKDEFWEIVDDKNRHQPYRVRLVMPG